MVIQQLKPVPFSVGPIEYPRHSDVTRQAFAHPTSQAVYIDCCGMLSAPKNPSLSSGLATQGPMMINVIMYDSVLIVIVGKQCKS